MKYEFFSFNEAMLHDLPVTPISEYRPPWSREAVLSEKVSKTRPDRRNGRTDICSGISTQNKIGWIVRSWTDMKITLDWSEAKIYVDFPAANPEEDNGFVPVQFFPPYLFTDFVKTPEGTFPTLLKINTPWRFKCPEGWGLMHSPLHFHNQTDYYSSTGILDPKHVNELNPVMFINTKKDSFIIKHGDPLFQITPIPLTQINSECRMATEAERKWGNMNYHIFRTRFRPAKKTFHKMYDYYFGGKNEK